MDDLSAIEGFEWNEGNRDKNWIAHKVRAEECEMVFFNSPFILLEDEKHSERESRIYGFGKTDSHRKLVIVFCIRKNRIRVISARDMNRNERRFYAEKEKDDSQV